MRFGKELRVIRESRHIEQQDLARLIDYSPAMLSQIELGNLLPSKKAFERLTSVLGLDSKAIEQLRQYLKQDQKILKKGYNEVFCFGPALRKMVEPLKKKNVISVVELAEIVKEAEEKQSSQQDRGKKKKAPVSLVHAWLKGSKLPGPETFDRTLIPILRGLAITEEQINELKIAHLKDTLTKVLAVAYLKVGQREKILAAAIAEAEREFSKSEKE